LAHAEAEFDHIAEPLSFYQNVSPSKDLRDASNQAEAQVREYGVEMSMRVDLFKAKQAAQNNIEKSGQKLDPEQKRLVEKMIQDGTRAGLALPDKEREELKKLKKELSNVCLEFSVSCPRPYAVYCIDLTSRHRKTLMRKRYATLRFIYRNAVVHAAQGTIAFTAEELKGVPEDVVSGFTKRSENSKDFYEVTFKTPDIFPVVRTISLLPILTHVLMVLQFKFAENPDTRKRAFEAYESRLQINVPVLDKILELRRKIADILGYATWADYVTEVKMVKDSKSAFEFLNDLEQKLRPVATKEREILLAMKQAEHKEKGLPFDGKFNIWDYRYYDRKYVEKTLDLDDMLVKEYFPVSVVVPVILDIYQNLLGVKFVEVKGKMWHPGN
jgi:Zn-dependent oligopeptidase